MGVVDRDEVHAALPQPVELFPRGAGSGEVFQIRAAEISEQDDPPGGAGLEGVASRGEHAFQVGAVVGGAKGFQLPAQRVHVHVVARGEFQ